LCLLDERLLRKVVGASDDDALMDLFGYKDEHTPMLYNLSHLKICFGHFGGDDEWTKFFERDRDNYSSQLISHPTRGIQFLEDVNGRFAKGKPEFIWKSVDWYTIITSLMLQYPNIYADISYILHDEHIMSLLKQTLQNEKLQTRVLYGTDFFVVRNHKSDKNMLADMMLGLSEAEFDLIARENPARFLNIIEMDDEETEYRMNEIVVN
jgi:predicted TIM-barrel fold metal-dependent hydrolase